MKISFFLVLIFSLTSVFAQKCNEKKLVAWFENKMDVVEEFKNAKTINLPSKNKRIKMFEKESMPLKKGIFQGNIYNYHYQIDVDSCTILLVSMNVLTADKQDTLDINSAIFRYARTPFKAPGSLHAICPGNLRHLLYITEYGEIEVNTDCLCFGKKSEPLKTKYCLDEMEYRFYHSYQSQILEKEYGSYMGQSLRRQMERGGKIQEGGIAEVEISE